MAIITDAAPKMYISSYDENKDREVTSITEISQRISEQDRQKLIGLVAILTANGITQTDD